MPGEASFAARLRRSLRRSEVFARRVGQRVLPAVVVILLHQTLSISRAVAAPVLLRAQPSRSEFSIHLGKAGLFRAFGDDHVIRVAEYQCDVLLDEQDLPRSSVRMTIPTAALKVVDAKLAAGKRAEVQKRMEGPEVLDIARFPKITFASRRVQSLGEGRFQVEGELKIREITRPVALQVSLVRESNGQHIRGEARIRQTAFGIRPVSVAGGTVKVKDEMKIVFHFLLEPARP